MRYAVVIERAARNYSAYAPDVPGCGATGRTVQETLANLREALRMHFEGMREDGGPAPDPETLVDYLDVDVAGGASADIASQGRPAEPAQKGERGSEPMTIGDSRPL